MSYFGPLVVNCEYEYLLVIVSFTLFAWCLTSSLVRLACANFLRCSFLDFILLNWLLVIASGIWGFCLLGLFFSLRWLSLLGWLLVFGLNRRLGCWAVLRLWNCSFLGMLFKLFLGFGVMQFYVFTMLLDLVDKSLEGHFELVVWGDSILLSTLVHISNHRFYFRWFQNVFWFPLTIIAFVSRTQWFPAGH